MCHEAPLESLERERSELSPLVAVLTYDALEEADAEEVGYDSTPPIGPECYPHVLSYTQEFWNSLR